MLQNNFQEFRILPVLEKAKSSYILWHSYHQILPKTHKHSLGDKIDKIFVDMLEAIIAANFLSPKEKEPFIRLSIRKLDTLKVFLMMLWETKSLDNKKYIALSEKINEIGRNLGGWRGKLLKDLGKQNSLKK